MTVLEQLTVHLEKKKMENSSFSLRLLAQKSGISVSYLSLIFSGKRKLQAKHLDVLSKALDLDRESKNNLYYKYLNECEIGKVEKKDIGNEATDHSKSVAKQQGISRLELLTPWYNLAVLDATLLINFDGTRGWISKKLGISFRKVSEAVNSLIEKGLLSENDGKLQKTDEKIEFRTFQKPQKLRNHHIEFLNLAKSNLEEKVSSEDLDKRLVSGMTVVLSHEKVQEIKSRLNDLLYEVLEMADKDKNTTEVYRLSLQFFPLNQE